MKFKCRPGFALFRSLDEALEFQTRGERSGVTPVVKEGQVREFPMTVLRELLRQSALGKLEPLDDEARAFYGDTVPMVSQTITYPERYVAPGPQPIFGDQ